jgi:hypothetical protein
MPHIGYDTSYKRAAEALQSAHEPAELARRCGANFAGGSFELDYFGNPCTVTLPECSFSPDLSLGEKILILHYIASDGPVEEKPGQATYEGLPGGMFYFSTFKKRGPNRVLNDYGDDPATLKKAAEISGWAEGDLGDASVVIPALPLIDVTVVIYAGDDEFPPEAKFLFRKDILSFLPLEDVAALAGYVATRLTILKKSL